MPRRARLSFLKVPHLILAYANDGTTLFEDEEDYQAYLDAIHQMVRDKILLAYAFCLLPCELRLVLCPLRLPLSRIMQRLHVRHSARMNNKLKRRGHLFRERFRSFIIPQDHLTQAIRSVHLWPVRTGLVRRTEHYDFSSHAAYLNSHHQHASILASQAILDTFSANLASAQRSFARFVESAALEEDDLGIEATRDELEHLLSTTQQHGQKQRSVRIPILAKRVALLLNIEASHLQRSSRRQDFVMARRLLATVCVTEMGRKVSDVADFLNRDKAQVSRLVSQGLDLLDIDEPFRQLYEAAKGTRVKTVN